MMHYAVEKLQTNKTNDLSFIVNKINHVIQKLTHQCYLKELKCKMVLQICAYNLAKTFKEN